MESKSRIVIFDYLRVILAFFVVAIHADTITSSPTNYLGGASWWLAAILNSLGRVSVPLFIMLSGALALSPISKVKSISTIFQRLGIPLLFWTACYNLWNVFYLHNSFSYSVGHLYYLFIALGLGLVTPYLRNHPNLLRIRYGLILLGISISIDIIHFFTGWGNFFFSIPILWTLYLGYFILGLSWKYKINQVITYLSIIFLAVCGAYSLYIGNWSDIHGSSAWWIVPAGNYYWSHFAPNIVISVIVIWSTINYLRSYIGNSSINKLVANLGSATYGIYLVHPFILGFMERQLGFEVHLITGNLALYYSVKIFVALILSYGLVLALKRTRVGSVVLGDILQTQNKKLS
ncbi:MAG: acyltransferase family protein [bacterium]